ncbi:hypothetical protein [Aurantimonas sp. 22II-16-19i]|uniref:hypothetical protein n=1 Tax=Aurantimonas sp. 22II-16-19i TaxID=1317114 RepID=UPI0009F7FB94|nr:hypothetical protein [Aurantimonas sp. 22II-16-19i]ORE97760.1 hypothetical protein ATO4_07470 [Aurantimonas sp. 22II-16-19i]
MCADNIAFHNTSNRFGHFAGLSRSPFAPIRAGHAGRRAGNAGEGAGVAAGKSAETDMTTLIANAG